MVHELIIISSLIALLFIGNLFLKIVERIYDNKALREELDKKEILIKLFNQYMSKEDLRKIIDIYRIKTDPDKWINFYPGYIRLILEESIYVDKRFHQTIRDYINDHPDTKDLPGSQIYINK